MCRRGPGGAPEAELSSEGALLPLHAASEGVSQSTGVYAPVGAKKEQRINVILKQIYKPGSGFSGSQRKCLPGGWQPPCGEGAGGAGPFASCPGPGPFSASLLSLSFLEAEPENWSGRTSALSATKKNNSKILSKRFQGAGC